MNKYRFTQTQAGEPDIGLPPVYETRTSAGIATVGKPDSWSNEFSATIETFTRFHTDDSRTHRGFGPTRGAAVKAAADKASQWKWLREDLTVPEAEGWLQAS